MARVLPDALKRVARWGTLSDPIVVRIQPTSGAMAVAAGRPEDTWLRGWARRGLVDIQSPRTWSRGRARDEAMTALLAHELTHCLLFQELGASWSRRDVPGWFEEGMASFTSGERRSGTGPADVSQAYGSADRAFRYLVARHGDEAVRAVLAALSTGQPFPSAFAAATGSPLPNFEEGLRLHLEAAAAR